MEKVNEPVRMILWDYDAAPDGRGMYVKLKTEFESIDDALGYRENYLHGMYWGHIEKLDGTHIMSLEEDRLDDNDDYNSYEDYDED